MEFDPTTHPHRRFNPLLDEHVLVSPHRTKRPWLGQTEAPQTVIPPEYDPACYLCPGNARSGGQLNPQYTHTHSFVNDFSAVLPGPAPDAPTPPHPMLTSQPNKGAMMGCSNNHPHGQAWSLSEVPSIPAKELASLERYSLSNPETTAGAPRGPHGRPCLLCEYAHAEVGLGQENGRVVLQNEHWVALVPWWAVWPFEIMLLPYCRHVTSIAALTDVEKTAFAEIISQITTRYDNLFQCPFAYSMGIHQRPTPGPDNSVNDDSVAHLHLHFDPCLLRSATVKKFLVGFELMAESQRDLTPEQAAERLRQCSSTHYLQPNA
ncbi:hypothetical protein NP233_g7867 [Leucocoprinus birnbaumii]|uniref:Galactose-1-phosphate uridylyltransferase n=1 Tax=Leucocoprinus birnbaumii TaxID=56174 RepID=A0AAD5VNC8_9AGAR|nr:hypothetical protein NP233_g7867 [Leucocoprinus birnbaumii]